MSNKTIDEIAADLTIAMLEHNSKLKHSNGGSSVNAVNANVISQNFQYFKEVILGNIDPLKKKTHSEE